MCTTSNNKRKLLSMVTFFFPSLNFPLIAFIFLHAHFFIINAWSLKLIWPITISLCVPYIATWKHLTSSLWMNVTNFIFWLRHTYNLPTLPILTPPCSPYTPFVNCAHLSANYDNTSTNCIDFSTHCANNFDDCANILNDWVNIVTDLTNILDISSLDFCIPNPSLFQLLFTNLLFM